DHRVLGVEHLIAPAPLLDRGRVREIELERRVPFPRALDLEIPLPDRDYALAPFLDADPTERDRVLLVGRDDGRDLARQRARLDAMPVVVDHAQRRDDGLEGAGVADLLELASEDFAVHVTHG